MTLRQFKAKAYLDGKWWMIEIEAIGALTQARRLNDVYQMARELIAVTLDQPLDSFDLEISIERVHDLDISSRIAKIQQEKLRAAELERVALEESKLLAQELADQKLTVREIGLILGVSHQRAHQLLSA